jgi:hypothetical protein
MPFSIAEVVDDPDFAQTFAVTRSQGGSWQSGKWIDNVTTVSMWGSIQPPTPEELDLVPEGDRVTGVIAIHCSNQIYETNVASKLGISDIVLWHNQSYRVLKVFPWNDYGYWKALACRMSGE